MIKFWPAMTPLKFFYDPTGPSAAAVWTAVRSPSQPNNSHQGYVRELEKPHSKKNLEKPRKRAHPFSFVSDASQISCGAASPLGPSAGGRPDRRSCSDLKTRVVRLTAVLLPLASRQGTPQIPNLQLTIKSEF